MIDAPVEPHQRTHSNEEFERDLPLRSDSDPPVTPQQDRVQADLDYRDGVEVTRIEYKYPSKVRPTHVAACVGGIVAMAVASLWLVTHAAHRGPVSNWAWPLPALSALSAAQVPDQLKNLPGKLAQVPTEKKQLPAGATDAVTPPPAPPPAVAVAPPAVEPPTPAAPPVTPQASTSSPSPLIDTDSSIRQVLGRYQTAFNTLDAGAASDVWPTLDQRTLDREFDQLAEQNVTFDECAIEVRGMLAEARCTGTIRFVPIDSQLAKVEPRRWNFTLRKAYTGWVIHEVTAR